MTDELVPGALFANVEERTAHGRLFTWGEVSRGSLNVSFTPEALKVPRDISVLNANIEHDRYKPAARFTSLEDDGIGPIARFAIADSDEGDELLAGIRSGRIKSLSAEVRDIRKRGTEAVSGHLSGAAFCEEGAFESAALFSLNPVVEEPEEEEALDEKHLRVALATEELPEDITAVTPEGQTAVYTTDETPSEETTNEEFTMTDAVIPDGVKVTPEDNKEELTASGLFSLIAEAKKTGNFKALEAIEESGSANFALTDVKTSGSNQLGTGTIQAKWLGELWTAQRERSVIPELKHADFEAFEVKGFRFTTPPTVAAWTGNKTEVPSPAIGVTPVAGVYQRLAAGYDIAREFFDIPAGAPVIESFLNKLVGSYSVVSDDYVLAQLVGAATEIEAETAPAGISEAENKIIDGALEIIAQGAKPTVAFVAPDVYKTIVKTPKDKITNYLASAMNLEEGSFAGLKVKPSIKLAPGQVLVLAREAATVFELPGSPIRVSALEVAKGGRDEAVHGYVGFIAEAPEAIVLVQDEVTP